MQRIDHLMWGAPDLEAAMADMTGRLGVAPVAGGSHPGRGTRNALVGLGPDCYLEIIAPDPAQPLPGTFGERLAALDRAALVTFAVASPDLDRQADWLRQRGVAARGPVPSRRATPDGGELRWALLFPFGHAFGSLFPFYIDWGDSPHPSAGLPDGGRLRELTLASPAAAELTGLLEDVTGPLTVHAAEEPSLQATLETAGGLVTLASTAAVTGLRFG